MDSSASTPTPFNSNNNTQMSPQGKFIQRLCRVEEENKYLKQKLSDLDKWKAAVETWLVDSFGFVAGSFSNYKRSH
jgi:hypothetical protein